MVLAAGLGAAYADGAAREAEQRALDEACETARAEKLVAVRRQLIAECVAQGDKTEAQCAEEYRHYGERSGRRPPLFYDLPACVAATEFRQGVRQAR